MHVLVQAAHTERRTHQHSATFTIVTAQEAGKGRALVALNSLNSFPGPRDYLERGHSCLHATFRLTVWSSIQGPHTCLRSTKTNKNTPLFKTSKTLHLILSHLVSHSNKLTSFQSTQRRECSLLIKAEVTQRQRHGLQKDRTEWRWEPQTQKPGTGVAPARHRMSAPQQDPLPSLLPFPHCSRRVVGTKSRLQFT